MGALLPESAPVPEAERQRSYADASNVLTAIPDLTRMCSTEDLHGREGDPIKIHQDIIATPSTIDIIVKIIVNAVQIDPTTAR